MKSEPSWWTYAIPIAAAAISLSGALYVGWRQRRMSRALVEFQADIADAVLCRQLCVALASRAHQVAGRASEVNRFLAAISAIKPRLRRDEIEKRSERLDRVCDSLFEVWSEILSSGLATPGLTSCLDEVGDELEAARLQILAENHEDAASSLHRVSEAARRCQAESKALAVLYADAPLSPSRVAVLPEDVPR